MNRIAAMARKAMMHILRDPRSLAVAILMPVAMVLVYGAVIDMELRELPVGVMDLDRSDLSRDLVREMTSSGFIVERTRLDARDEIESAARLLDVAEEDLLVVDGVVQADVSSEVATRATQHLYIVNPLKPFEKRAKSLFSTHPPIEDRIERIMSM